MPPAAAVEAGPREVAGARLPGWLGWLLAWLSFGPLALLRAGQLSESDTFWQIRTGQLILADGAVPRVDTLSWTASGEPWTLNSWAFDVLLALAHRAGGLPAAALLGALLAALAIGAVLVLCFRLGASPAISAVVVALASAPLIGWLSVRPQLVDYIAVPVLVLVLRRIAGSPRPLPWVLGAVALTLVWVNLHAAGLLGAGIAAAAGLALLVPAGSRRRGGLLLGTAALMAAATLATPYGLGVYQQAASVRGASAGVVLEWSAFNPADVGQVVMLLAGLGAIVVALRAREPVLVAALAVTAAGGVFAIRLLPVLLLLAIAPLALAASRRPVLDYLWSRRAVTVPAAAVWLVVAGWLAAPSLGHLGRPDALRYSPVAIAAIPDGCRVVNTYDVGGYLLLLRPGVLDSIDSRNDLFGAERVLAGEDLIAARGDIAAGLSGAGCALLPLDSPLAARLATDPGWREAARDPVQLLFVRD